MIEPVKKTLHVPLTTEKAFDLFTTRMGEWWPTETHSISGSDAADVTVEPREGGKIIEKAPDGATHDWATVTTWVPGERFAFDWYVGRDPSQATQVDVGFVAEGDGTRVTLVHDGWEALGDEAAGLREGYHSGWDGVLTSCYGGACQKVAA